MSRGDSTSDFWRAIAKRLARFAILPALLVSMRTSLGQSPLPLPDPQQTLTNIPFPAPFPTTFGSLPSSLRFSPSGQLFASTGTSVLEDIGGTFSTIGTISTAGSDPGAINFSRDGQTILVSNGGGGPSFSDPTINGNLYTLPNPGSVLPPDFTPSAATLVGNVPNNYDFIPVPAALPMHHAANKFLVDVGSSDFSSSEVDVFDIKTGHDHPLITNILGPSASLAWDPLTNELYVANGNPVAAGQASIMKFNLAALESGPVDWSSGTPVYGPTSDDVGEIVGGGMFFDSKGDLFTGASDGLLVITPNAALLYDSTVDPFVFGSVAYDQATNGITDQFLLQGFGTPTMIFDAAEFVPPVPEPSRWMALSGGGLMMFVLRRRLLRAKAAINMVSRS